jgi:hypothetical protein
MKKFKSFIGVLVAIIAIGITGIVSGDLMQVLTGIILVVGVIIVVVLAVVVIKWIFRKFFSN